MRKGYVALAAVLFAAAPTARAAVVNNLTDDFTADTIDPLKWTVIDRGLESTAATNIAADTTTNPDELTFNGSTSTDFWAGKSLQSVDTFSTVQQTTVLVDRVSVAGTGIYRSSVWVFDDAGHYVHFAHLKNEGGGWSYNARDDGGTGGNNPTGSGVNIATLDGFDADNGLVTMKLVFTPIGAAGSGDGTIAMSLIKNGVETVGASQAVTNWGSDFNVLLTGQARASGNTVTARFDNVNVQSVPIPEPTALAAVAGLGLLAATRRPRRVAR